MNPWIYVSILTPILAYVLGLAIGAWWGYDEGYKNAWRDRGVQITKAMDPHFDKLLNRSSGGDQ